MPMGARRLRSGYPPAGIDSPSASLRPAGSARSGREVHEVRVHEGVEALVNVTKMACAIQSSRCCSRDLTRALRRPRVRSPARRVPVREDRSRTAAATSRPMPQPRGASHAPRPLVWPPSRVLHPASQRLEQHRIRSRPGDGRRRRRHVGAVAGPDPPPRYQDQRMNAPHGDTPVRAVSAVMVSPGKGTGSGASWATPTGRGGRRRGERSRGVHATRQHPFLPAGGGTRHFQHGVRPVGAVGQHLQRSRLDLHAKTPGMRWLAELSVELEEERRVPIVAISSDSTRSMVTLRIPRCVPRRILGSVRAMR